MSPENFFILAAVICYFLGSIPFGLIIGKINGINIREHGSGNIGATNVLRTLGKKWGITCFTLDFLKGFLPVFFLGKYAQSMEAFAPDAYRLQVLAVICILCTVFGHIFSLWIKFKGGKGIATSAGAIIAVHPIGVLVVLVVWFVIFKASGYVSLASIIAACVLPFSSLAENYLNKQPLMNPVIYMLFFIAVMVTVKHRSNIRRLMDGTESSFKNKGEANESNSA